MIILYILLIAYILSINFYAYLLVKSLRDKEREEETKRAADKMSAAIPTTFSESASATSTAPAKTTNASQPNEKVSGKLYITGLLGGAISIYLCMFLLKYRRSDLLLMVTMPLLGVLNIYLWVLLFRSGFSFFVIR